MFTAQNIMINVFNIKILLLICFEFPKHTLSTSFSSSSSVSSSEEGTFKIHPNLIDFADTATSEDHSETWLPVKKKGLTRTSSTLKDLSIEKMSISQPNQNHHLENQKIKNSFSSTLKSLPSKQHNQMENKRKVVAQKSDSNQTTKRRRKLYRSFSEGRQKDVHRVDSLHHVQPMNLF